MRQVAGLISTYSSDEFGICSALYELGGMVVMHDASGCNSTYTTHDEPRWYDMDSMIFISAISEMEAILGDDEKLIRDIVETANQLHPKFIAIVGAPIPYMIGTDLDAIANIVEKETGIPSFGFQANGMQNYTKGISMALLKITDYFCIKQYEKTQKLSVNLMGATPLDYSLNGSIPSIKKWLEECGMQVQSCFAMGCSLEQIAQASAAHVNLVLSYGGLSAARLLKERFGIPYVIGVPFGKNFSKELSVLIKNTAKTGRSMSGAKKKSRWNAKRKIALIGESVFGTSLATALEMEYDWNVKVLTPLDTEPEILREGDVKTPDEDDIMIWLESADGLIADPLYRSLCEKMDFYSLPHEAFSGRMFEKENPNLINRNLK